MSRSAELFSHDTLASYLGARFAERKHKNDSYSLRAFARDLELSASRLSEVLKGHQGLSEKSAELIAKKLKLKPKERTYLKDLILAERSRSEQVRTMASARLNEVRTRERYKKIQEDQFRVIADWHHSAILELAQLEEYFGVSMEVLLQSLSRRLGIPARTVDEALTRLQALNLLTRTKAGRWVSNPDAYGAFTETPSASIRKFHRQVLNLQLNSLMEDPMEEREFISTILALPKENLNDFKKAMQDFVTAFWQRAEDQPKNVLYALSLQLAPVKNRSRRS